MNSEEFCVEFRSIPSDSVRFGYIPSNSEGFFFIFSTRSPRSLESRLSLHFIRAYPRRQFDSWDKRRLAPNDHTNQMMTCVWREFSCFQENSSYRYSMGHSPSRRSAHTMGIYDECFAQRSRVLDSRTRGDDWKVPCAELAEDALNSRRCFVGVRQPW